MLALANLTTLQAEGSLTRAQADRIATLSRQMMTTLAGNVLMTAGIAATVIGAIGWLNDTLGIALVGLCLLAAGWAPGLMRRSARATKHGTSPAARRWTFLTTALQVIGALMLGAAGTAWLHDTWGGRAALPIAAIGTVLGVFSGIALQGRGANRFLAACCVMMGAAMHLFGLGSAIDPMWLSGHAEALFCLYVALTVAACGLACDTRFVTALAIVPFAAVLDTGTGYFGASYGFWSRHPGPSILQMAALMLVLALPIRLLPERLARHARALSMMAFIIANLCALVGSLFTVELMGVTLSRGGVSLLWAGALAVLIVLAALRGDRVRFNTALTFAGIHGYTQLFESLGSQPMSWMLAGIAVLPLAWGLRRMNRRGPGQAFAA